MIVKLVLEMVSQESYEDESTLVHTKRAITHEQIKQLEHLSFNALLSIFISNHYSSFLDCTVINFVLRSNLVRLVLDQCLAIGSFSAVLLVHQHIKDLSLQRVGKSTAIHNILIDHLVLSPREQVAPRQNLNFPVTNDQHL